MRQLAIAVSLSTPGLGTWHMALGALHANGALFAWRLLVVCSLAVAATGTQRDNGLGSAHVANKQTLNELARPQGHDNKARTFLWHATSASSAP